MNANRVATMNCGVVDSNSISLSSTHAGHSNHALGLPGGYLITPARRRHLLQSERIGVRSGKRVLGLAAYNTGTWHRVAHHFLVDRSLDPPGTQLVTDVLIMALEIAALRDEIGSLTLVVSDRALLTRLAGHGYLSVLQNSHEVWVQQTVYCNSGNPAA